MSVHGISAVQAIYICYPFLLQGHDADACADQLACDMASEVLTESHQPGPPCMLVGWVKRPETGSNIGHNLCHAV